MNVRIAGTGSYVPERVLTNHDLERMVETNDEWIRTRTGIEERHLATPEQATSDLAVNAALKALESANIKADQLGAIIVATITPDHFFPNTACVVQERIGASNAFCFDIEAACSGLLYTIEVARGLMSNNSALKYILVIGAEKLSSIVNWTDRNTCVLFGDGAAALVLEQTANAESGVLATDLGSDGCYGNLLKAQAGGSRQPSTPESLANHEHCISMAGKEIFKIAVNAMVSSSQRVLEKANVPVDKVRWLVPHQANYRIMAAVAQRLELTEENVYMNISRYGNTSAASIGLCLDEMNRQGLLKVGDYVLLTAFGGGLTWCSVLLKW